MTAVNIAVTKRAAHIMTDGLSYDKDGTVVEVSPSVGRYPSECRGRVHGAVPCQYRHSGRIHKAVCVLR